MGKTRGLRDRIVAIILSLMVMITYVPLLGGAVYADPITYTNVSTDHTDIFANNYGPVISSNKAEYTLDENIYIKVENSSYATSGGWIDIYKELEANNNTTTQVWTYTGSGTVSDVTDYCIYGPDKNNGVTVNTELQEGNYYITLMASDGRWAVLPITIGNPPPVTATVSTDKTEYEEGEPVVVTCATNDNSGGWVAVQEGHVTSYDNPAVLWYYPYGTGSKNQTYDRTPDGTEQSYNLIPDVGTLSAGEWTIFYSDVNNNPLSNFVHITINGEEVVYEGYDIELNAPLPAVSSGGVDYAGGFCPNTPITVTAVAPETDETAWVGVFQATATSFGSGSLAWGYVKDVPNGEYDFSKGGNGVAINTEGFQEGGQYQIVICPEDSGTAIKRIYFYINGVHHLTAHSAVDPTCTEGGNSAYWSCDRCGRFFSDAEGAAEIEENGWVIPAAEHSWDDGIITTDPTCTEQGVKTFTCSVCHDTRTEVVDALGHTMTAHAAVAPTCEGSGTEAYWTCSVCEKMFADAEGNSEITEPEKTDPLGHNYELTGWEWADDMSSAKAVFTCSHDDTHVVKVDAEITEEVIEAPTCEESGETDYTATVEFYGETYSDIQTGAVDALGHDYEAAYEWSEDGSTCTATATCKNDAAHVVTEEGVITSAVKTEAKCGVKGTTTYTATFENELFETQTKDIDDIAALEHKYEDVADTAKPATCTEEGKKADRKCSLCGDEIKGEAIPALGHSLSKVAAKEATAEAEGNIEYWTCSVCGKFFSDAEGKTEIKEADTVIPKVEPTPEVPDDSASLIEKAKKAVAEAVEKAESIIKDNKDKYSEETYSKLEDAVNKAKAAIAKADATAEELNNAAAAITTAISNLEEITPDDAASVKEKAKQAVADAIEAAENSIKENKDKYTAETYKKIEETIANAKEIAAKANVSVEELNNAAAAIAAVIKEAEAEKAVAEAAQALKNAAAEAKKIEQGNYTDESYKALQDAIAEAEALANDPNATADQLKAAADKLEAAKAGLKEKEAAPAKAAVKVGDTVKYNKHTYKVTSIKSKTVAFTKSKNVKTVAVPATIKVDGKTYKVTAVNAKAFTAKKIRYVTIGKNVKKIKLNAFKGSKVTTVTLKTRLLKKSYVKGALKSSKVKTIKVKVSTGKKTNKSYLTKYKKYFTKTNAGRKVTVK